VANPQGWPPPPKGGGSPQTPGLGGPPPFGGVKKKKKFFFFFDPPPGGYRGLSVTPHQDVGLVVRDSGCGLRRPSQSAHPWGYTPRRGEVWGRWLWGGGWRGQQYSLATPPSPIHPIQYGEYGDFFFSPLEIDVIQSIRYGEYGEVDFKKYEGYLVSYVKGAPRQGLGESGL